MNVSTEPVFPRPLVDVLLREPDVPAFEYRARPIPRVAVLRLVRQAVRGLSAAGLGPGSAVAVTTAVTPHGFAAQIAAHLLGCRVTGLRPGLTPPQLAHVLGQGVDAVLADGTTADESLAAAARAAGARHLDLARDVLPDAVPSSGWDGPARTGEVAELRSTPELAARGRQDDVALITLTSGSTGNPKGCAQTYAALSRHWSWQPPERWTAVARELAVGYRRFLVFGTLTSAVMMEHLAVCLLSGGTAVIPEAPVSFPHTWARHRVTACLCTVPRLYQVLDVLRAEPVDTSAMRALLVAGSPLPAHRMAEAVDLLGPVVYQGYGQTETGMLTLLTPADIAARGAQVLDTVGRPVPGADVSVRDPEGTPVPAGTAGEVWVRTDGMMSGYWQEPQRTAEVVTDGWIRTRDLGTLGPDGFLRLVGRARDVVFVNAILYYTGAIETVLCEHGDVDQAYVVAAPDERTGEAAHAFLVAAPGRTPDPGELRKAVGAALGDGAVPATFTLIDAVPTAPGGKPDKRALLARVRQSGGAEATGGA
ncbi:class I adenylate-forming enzyme family protein [Actinacidiphila bryophytorum]|uniref:Acyl-CoA synthetase (AMP-forming)/AMP-acid ligase II n=1 Tax=Actinacidiphila bryophytorum TaxID=1436133 RepID=A0A9W4GYG0_9ACTN|nr:fatty acid--CoA ligase family protein [Actinacidiphila bryophytorum]MBM9438483.1 long-chain fatty acid--CoA ligase [Actinacidiphila bryophytorum]MBN6542889.1 long-chain fatty acid--CoA ligase [Actinacidiphila bryophytorum]CAG7613149.1 Acyl-CoA synthetase (AMP-forming)/AMP-acid ligase II [Actinacidiphila bryophytorum]